MITKKELQNLVKIENENYVMGYCRSSDLEEIKVKWSLPIFDYGKRPSYYLKNARTVIVVGNAVDSSKDVCHRSVLGDDYPGYKRANEVAKRIQVYLKSQGAAARTAPGISYKNAAVLSGIGAWGKNALVVHEKYGTMLRFACVVTDWVPDSYPEKIGRKVCDNCELCIAACPYGCLHDYKVTAGKCFCKYVKRGQLSMALPMCSKCQDVCPYNHLELKQKAPGFIRKDISSQLENLNVYLSESEDETYQENQQQKSELIHQLFHSISLQLEQSGIKDLSEWSNSFPSNSTCTEATYRQINTLFWFLGTVSERNYNKAYHYLDEYVDNYHQGDIAKINSYELQVILLMLWILQRMV